MSATKQKILKTSLDLFNEMGITKTSLRGIADKAGISVGNLQYHFKKREEIVEALYFQLVEEMNHKFIIPKEKLFTSFLSTFEKVIEGFYAYRFFFLDFVSISRKHQKIKYHYRDLTKQREQIALALFDQLIKEGLFRQELLHDEYRNVYKRIEVLSNFWFSSILIQEDTIKETTIKDFSEVILQSVYPYLTEKGRGEFSALYPRSIKEQG